MGRFLIRRLLPAVIIISIVLGWLRLQGEQAGLYGTTVGTSLFTAANVLIISALILWSARLFYRLEDKRTQAKESQQQAEASYRALVERMPAVVYIQEIGSSDSAMYMSPQIENLTGYSPEECKDPDLRWRMVHPDDRERLQSEDERTGEPGEVFITEYRVVRRDGRVVWVRNESVIVEDEPSGSRYWQGFMLDITERKQAEEELRETARLFRSTFENAPIGMALVSLDNHYLRVNQAFCEMLGYSQEELLSRRTLEVTHPDDREASTARTKALLEGKIARDLLEKRYIRGDGQVVWALSSVSLVRDSGGDPAYFVSQYQDITERKHAEEEIRQLNESLERRVEERTAELENAIADLSESEERYALVVEGSNDGIFDWDLRTGELYWNDRLFEMLGLSRSEVSPSFELFAELLHPDDRQRAMDAVNAHLERGENYDEEFRIRDTSGGYRHCIGRGKAQREEDGTPYRMAGSVIDITERKESERELRRAEARYRALVEQIPAVTYIEAVDDEERATNLLYVSPQIETMFGYSPEEWMADPQLFAPLLHPDDRDRVLAEDQRTDESGEPFQIEYRHFSKDGR